MQRVSLKSNNPALIEFKFKKSILNRLRTQYLLQESIVFKESMMNNNLRKLNTSKCALKKTEQQSDKLLQQERP